MSEEGKKAGKTFLQTTFKTGFYIFSGVMALSLTALAWQFVQLYEVSVKAQSVQAQIMMEQHQMMKQDMEARKQAAMKFDKKEREAVKQDVIDDLTAMPKTLNSEE